MLTIRFTSYVLGFLFVSHVLNDSSVYAHEGRKELLVTIKDASEEKEDLNGIVTASATIIGLGRGKMVEYKELTKENEGVRKGQSGGTSEISGADCDFEEKKDFNVKSSSIDLGDRRNKTSKEGAGFIAFSADYHGEDRKASSDSLGKSQENLSSQQDIKAVLESNNLETVSLTTPRNKATNLLMNSNPKHSQHSIAEPLPQESSESSAVSEESVDNDTSEKDEARMLLEVTKEMVNLMHKDYKGMGRRNPPINHHEPWH